MIISRQAAKSSASLRLFVSDLSDFVRLCLSTDHRLDFQHTYQPRHFYVMQSYMFVFAVAVPLIAARHHHNHHRSSTDFEESTTTPSTPPPTTATMSHDVHVVSRRVSDEPEIVTGEPPANVYGFCGSACPKGYVCRMTVSPPADCHGAPVCDIYRLRCVRP